MESYIIANPCGLCYNEYIVCPLAYKCGHSFCVKCLYPNRNNLYLKKCPICRIDDDSLSKNNSPIYNLKFITNYIKFYETFLAKSIECISIDQLQTKISKNIILEFDSIDSAKQNSQNISYIGILSNYIYENNFLKIQLENCFYLNKNEFHIYPTYPLTKSNLAITHVSKIYAEI
jgi:hypothetical protein